MADPLHELERKLSEARQRRAEASAARPDEGRDRYLQSVEADIRGYEEEIARLDAARKAAMAPPPPPPAAFDYRPTQADFAAMDRSMLEARGAKERAEKAQEERVQKGLRGCGVPAAVAAVVTVAAAAILGLVFLGDDEDPAAKCSRPTTTLGGVQVQLVAADCEPTTTPSATDPDTSAPATGIPDAADLPPGQVPYQGTTGGQLGCIACDGQSRFINIDKSTTALGDAERAGQEIVWPENGAVVDFGIQIPRPNKGRYGINLFVNGAYSVGCPIETGSSSCRVLEGQDPSPLAAGDRVTIIVGEAGTVDENGVPVEEGDFVLEWWFVFQPE